MMNCRISAMDQANEASGISEKIADPGIFTQ
jgi:hypothetical protein